MNPYRENAYQEDKKIIIDDVIDRLCEAPPESFVRDVSECITLELNKDSKISVEAIYYDTTKIKIVIWDEAWLRKTYTITGKSLREKINNKCKEVSSYYEQKMLRTVMDGMK